MIKGELIHSTELTSEPNGKVFRAFAEFSGVPIEELKNLPQYKLALKSLEEMKPALVFGIALLPKINPVYPASYEAMSNSVNSANLARLLDAELDQRPDREDIEKAIGCTALLANRTAFPCKVTPLGSC
jgi:hypothetical protein